MLSQVAELLAPAMEGAAKTVMISDALEADGAFLLHHFLATAAKDATPLCFLHFAQTFNHYNLVAQKLGSSLNAAVENKRLRAIDGLTLLGDALLNQNAVAAADADATTAADATLSPWRDVAEGSLKTLYDVIVGEIDGLTTDSADPDRRLLLVLDDVSVLSSLGHATSRVAAMLYALIRRLASLPAATLVFLLHRDVEDDDDDEDAVSLTKLLAHRVDVHLAVRGLASGFSRDVHGSLVVARRIYSEATEMEDRGVVERQFKLTDREASLFAPGLSNAVI